MAETLHARRRLAGAPISWGVCEVPGWGLQLPPDRVLSEMAALGLHATELGPDGWLPLERRRRARCSTATGCGWSAGSCRSSCTSRPRAPASAPALGRAARRRRRARSSSPRSSRTRTGSTPVALDERRLGALVEHLREIDELVAGRGPDARAPPARRHARSRRRTTSSSALADTDAGWCFDTGHLLIGGRRPGRVRRASTATASSTSTSRTSTQSSPSACARGSCRSSKATQRACSGPLGDGDARIDEVVRAPRPGGLRALARARAGPRHHRARSRRSVTVRPSMSRGASSSCPPRLPRERFQTMKRLARQFSWPSWRWPLRWSRPAAAATDKSTRDGSSASSGGTRAVNLTQGANSRSRWSRTATRARSGRW